jgi:hypothetical protein
VPSHPVTMLKHTTDKTAAATRDFITPIVNG